MGKGLQVVRCLFDRLALLPSSTTPVTAATGACASAPAPAPSAKANNPSASSSSADFVSSASSLAGGAGVAGGAGAGGGGGRGGGGGEVVRSRAAFSDGLLPNVFLAASIRKLGNQFKDTQGNQ